MRVEGFAVIARVYRQGKYIRLEHIHAHENKEDAANISAGMAKEPPALQSRQDARAKRRSG